MRFAVLSVALLAVGLGACVLVGLAALKPASLNSHINNIDNNVIDVTIQDFTFTPQQLTIKPGETVRWVNLDAIPHTITSDTGSELGSDELAQGDSYTHQFANAGTFTYHCTIRPEMTASVIVQP